MGQFIVTAAEVKKAMNELKKANADLKKQIDDLQSKEQALASQWEGDAQKAFRAEFNKDKSKMENFYKEIEKYCSALDNIAKQYETTESKNVEIAKSRK